MDVSEILFATDEVGGDSSEVRGVCGIAALHALLDELVIADLVLNLVTDV